MKGKTRLLNHFHRRIFFFFLLFEIPFFVIENIKIAVTHKYTYFMPQSLFLSVVI